MVVSVSLLLLAVSFGGVLVVGEWGWIGGKSLEYINWI